MATPRPMTALASISVMVSGDSPRPAEPMTMITMASARVLRGPIRAMAREPGMEPTASINIGRVVSAPVRAWDRLSSSLMNGARGGATNTGMRR